MKKYLLTAGMVILFGIYLVYQRTGSTKPANTDLIPLSTTTVDTTTPAQNTTTTSTGSAPPINTRGGSSSSTKTTIPTPVRTPTPAGQYKDGSYIGTRADAYYGYIQVKAIITGGRLTDIQFLEYPNDRDNSVSINSRALPILRSEAIQAQSANVALVSRATDSSEAFRTSLISALAQAKN